MRFIALTRKHFPQGHIAVDYDHIIAMEDNRFNTNNEDYAWTNVWLSNGVKFEVLETEKEILDMIWIEEQRIKNN